MRGQDTRHAGLGEMQVEWILHLVGEPAQLEVDELPGSRHREAQPVVGHARIHAVGEDAEPGETVEYGPRIDHVPGRRRRRRRSLKHRDTYARAGQAKGGDQPDRPGADHDDLRIFHPATPTTVFPRDLPEY
jgi:hypothetical protein